jgi:hypothetical protein
MQYRSMADMLIAVPNGGSRHPREALNLKKQGVLSGVADLLLLIKSPPFGCLCIEMKTEKGKQSENQQRWEESARKHGNKYVVCRSIEEFIQIINEYLEMA